MVEFKESTVDNFHSHAFGIYLLIKRVIDFNKHSINLSATPRIDINNVSMVKISRMPHVDWLLLDCEFWFLCKKLLIFCLFSFHRFHYSWLSSEFMFSYLLNLLVFIAIFSSLSFEKFRISYSSRFFLSTIHRFFSIFPFIALVSLIIDIIGVVIIRHTKLHNFISLMELHEKYLIVLHISSRLA